MSTAPPTDPPADPPTGDPAAGSPTGRPNLPGRLTRARDGRWLAGVCAGLARQRNLPPASVRIGFALAGLVGGIGVLAYLACWLIIPAESDSDSGDGGGAPVVRGIVVLAQLCAACVGLATLAVVGASGAIFGFGWIVLAVATAILVGVLASWPRVGAGWALLPVAALVLPAFAMNVGGIRVAAQTADVVHAPRSVAAVPHRGYRSGLGSLMVDLRRTAVPATGNLALRIDAGLRRTIVALPADRCIFVDLHYDVVPFAAQLVSVLTGMQPPYSVVTLFGTPQFARAGETGNVPGTNRAKGPVLTIYFHSAGGGLYVRDYPNTVDPQGQPDWPGYPVSLEPRPDVVGIPRAAARQEIDAWLLRRRVQSASAAQINRLLPGPCGPPRTQPAETSAETSGPATGSAVPKPPEPLQHPQAPQPPQPAKPFLVGP